ncbi:hypothetical protein ABEO79_00190 [Micromonospora provocatoris]
MTFKIYRAKMNTGNKTPNNILERAEADLSDKEIETAIEYFNCFDGVVAFVVRGFGGKGWSLVAWEQEFDNQIKEATYLAEQDPMFGTYIDQREEFDRDWENNEYCPTGSLFFTEDDIEILEEVSNERV